jgi:hypothetical protein
VIGSPVSRCRPPIGVSKELRSLEPERQELTLPPKNIDQFHVGTSQAHDANNWILLEDFLFRKDNLPGATFGPGCPKIPFGFI